MITGSALISACGTYRYHLHREWGQGPRLVFVMLNPSTADGSADDPTIRRCVGFAQVHGFDGIEVVNLYAYRATSPRDLADNGWLIGPDNDHTIVATAERAARSGGAVCCAWGAHAAKRERPSTVLSLLQRAGAAPQCLERTKAGHPAHPLYLPGATNLRAYP